MRWVLLLTALCIVTSVRCTPSSREYYALRHGQSLANVQGVISSDPRVACREHGLSEAGWEQAAAAAREICNEATRRGYDGVAIVSSDFRRASQTAEAVLAGCAASGVRTWPRGVEWEVDLRERWFGELNGQSDARYADCWAEDSLDASHRCFGCEAVASVRARAAAVVRALERHADLSEGRWMVVLVAHGDVLQILQTAFAGVDPRAHRSLDHLQTATLRPLRLVARPGVDSMDNVC